MMAPEPSFLVTGQSVQPLFCPLQYGGRMKTGQHPDLHHQTFTRHVPELNKEVTWFISPMQWAMCLDHLRGDNSRIHWVDYQAMYQASCLTERQEGKTLDKEYLTIPPIVTSIKFPFGSFAYLVDGIHRLEGLKRYQLELIPIYIPDQALQDRCILPSANRPVEVLKVIQSFEQEHQHFKEELKRHGLDAPSYPHPLREAGLNL